MPTSVLWVTLIAVWLFVLIPMVLRGRPQARKTTAAAANTRLVHRGGSSRTGASRTAARTRAAQRAAANADEQAEERRRKAAAAKAAAAKAAAEAAEAIKSAETDTVEDDIEDGDVVGADETDGPTLDAELVDDDTETDEVVETVDAEDIVDAEIDDAAEVEEEPAVETEKVDVVSAAEMTDQISVVEDDVVDIDEAQAARDTDQIPAVEDERDDEELDDDASDDFDEVLDEDADDEDAAEPEPSPRELRGRGGYGPDRVAEREAMQYRERQRMVIGLGVVTIGAIVSAFFFQPWGIAFACGMVAAFGTYLWLLRRAVREEQARHAVRAARRRRQQAEDARLESRQAEPTYVEPPARLRRPGGAIILEIDDEDPAFDHLPTYDFADAMGYRDEYDDQDRVAYGRAAV
ncbi:gephyrin-like molybdotransferase receptor GlpR [Gordonia phthalatica]|uniref:Transmembrane protein n=1 Tax=Gordonia phthalatica TaxID=1136941 RepID=A0A0N9N956_9ACTN|nr:gephyrin-like molybdotransferase receptor GlpR [Gordonia phthalatica]ALG83896.1 hypothetical protein ACH46_04415 [Gordonia phthalatica]